MSIRVVARWKGGAFQKAVHKGLGENLALAATRARDDIRASISKHVFPRSAPGDPPRLETGDLLRSYFAFTDRKALTAEVGSSIAYSRFLELGTRRMAPRPHIRRVIFSSPAVRILLCRRITQP